MNLMQPQDCSTLSASEGICSIEGTVNITDCSFQCFALTYFSL